VAASLTPPDVPDAELSLLLDAIYERYHYDFRGYAPASLRRRVAGAVQRLGCSSAAELAARLRGEEAIFPQILQILTVPVSDLFRDAAFFRAVREQVVPVLLTYPSVRLWVAGCSTGEEVWSYLVIFAEEGLLDRTRVYATDINPESLRQAEQGVYDVRRAQRFSASYQLSGGRGSLSDWVTAGYGGVVFDRRLREHVVFSDHSLATDEVFAEVTMVSCRNVLIYFGGALQARAVGLFAGALSRRGFLAIGSRESLRFSDPAAEFEPFLDEQRIYRKRR
jgi:chemotaxis protein methyltransferase CheR